MYKVLRGMSFSSIFVSQWISKIKALLDNLGMSNLWYTEDEIDKNWFKCAVNLRQMDISKQEWSAEVHASGQCRDYRLIKKDLKMEHYLLKLDKRDRINLCKFRCGNSRLPVNTGRFSNVPRQERYCTLCTKQRIGDEFHYLFECPILNDDRCKYLKPYYIQMPNTCKMTQLFNTGSVRILKDLARFCQIIMSKF